MFQHSAKREPLLFLSDLTDGPLDVCGLAPTAFAKEENQHVTPADYAFLRHTQADAARDPRLIGPRVSVIHQLYLWQPFSKAVSAEKVAYVSCNAMQLPSVPYRRELSIFVLSYFYSLV
jgi:hypothetical protein